MRQETGNDHLPFLLEVAFPIETIDQFDHEHGRKHGGGRKNEPEHARRDGHTTRADEETIGDAKYLVVTSELDSPTPLQDTPDIHHAGVNDSNQDIAKERL